MNQAMSVNRPSGYVDPGKVTIAAAAATTALHAFQTGGMNPLLAFGGLGMLAAPGMMPGAPGMAFPPAPVPGMMYNPAAVAYPGAAAQPPQQQLPYGMMGLPGPPAAAVGDAPTQCLCVVGMVGADVLANDLEYADVSRRARPWGNTYEI